MDWKQVIQHAEQIERIVSTKKITTGNWVAWLPDNAELNQNGSTESEAIGNLVRTYIEAIIERINAPLEEKLTRIRTIAEEVLAEDGANVSDYCEALNEIRDSA